MPDVKLLPPSRINPYAYDNSKAVMSMMNILGSTEAARRKKIMIENILGALSRGEGREGISSAALMEPGFSSGIPGALQRIGSPFAVQTPGIEDIIAGRGIEEAFDTRRLGVLPGLWDIASPAQREGYLERWGGQTASSKTPLSEPQVSAYSEAMDKRIKRVDRFRPGLKDFNEKDLFKEWQKFAAMYKFKNDTQREQAWNVWKNKIDNLGDEVDWNPTDPKWREEIGLRAETSGLPLKRTFGPGDIRMQSAPDIALDPYWGEMTEEEKKTALEHLDANGSVEDIINLLK